jgi:hypothetical protein
MKIVVKKEFTCGNSDLNVIGVELGFQWNQVCDWIRKNGIHGEDGCGYYYLCYEDYEPEDLEVGMYRILKELFIQSNFEDIKIFDN